ncbi:hypothetical protein ACIOJD_28280 [Streptomyces sp. NPDC088116]|uniref:hypothetical protein n=1 Tax=Streptomyces sp. NPDC088116 TaxID=3365825 RepID=UPI00381619A9
MYGPGPGFQPTTRRRPNPAGLIIARVVIVTLTMVSVGFLGWVAMLRIAAARRRTADWLLFGVSAVLAVGSLVVIGSGESSEARDVDVLLMGLNFLASIVISPYFLAVDIRHYAQYDQPPAVAYGPGHQPPQQPYGFGYPGQSTAQTAQTRPTSQPLSQPVQLPQQPQQPPHSQPSSASYKPPRIDQVRAELDELSDLLRKDRASRDGQADQAGHEDRTTREGRDGE